MSQTWVTLIIGMATVIGSFFVARVSAPKIRAEAKEIVGRTYKSLIAELRTEIQANKSEIKQVKEELRWERKRNYDLVNWSKALTAQVFEHGGEPVEYEDFRH